MDSVKLALGRADAAACFALEPVFVHTLGTVEKLRTLKEAVANGDGIIDWTWWMLPPFVLLFAAVIVLLVQRKWMLFFAAGTFFARIPLVFLTAPDTYFLYYLTPFIAGYAVAAAGVLYAVMRRKLKVERNPG